jgi:hypothetical protein
MFLPMSDAKKAVNAAKKNELKGKGRFVLALVGRHKNPTSYIHRTRIAP